jgi:hypothetical protein
MRGSIIKVVARWLLTLALSFAAGAIAAAPAAAISVYDFFTISYDAELSQPVVGGGEVFQATVQGTADCKQDLPLSISRGYVTSRVTAQHHESGRKITLNPSYTMNIEPFPNEAGETTQAEVLIPLSFPSGTAPGTYDIAAEPIEAGVQSSLGFWLLVTPYLPPFEELGSVLYRPESEEAMVTGSVFELSAYLDNGVFTRDSVFSSPDDRCQIVINRDTLCLTENGEPLGELTIAGMETPPDPPQGYRTVGTVYQLEPQGATFDPPLTITLGYEAPMIPAAAAEGEMVIGTWDEANGWAILEESSLEPGSDTISTTLSHLATLATLAPTPSHRVTELTIAPEEADVGEEIAINVLLTNLSQLEGSFTVTLKINSTASATSNVTLAGDSSQRVIFIIQKDVPGTYSVDVNGLSGAFRVVGAEPGGRNPGLIGGIIASVAAAIAVPLALRRRRRKAG